MKKQSPTLRDVAALAGVSATTVSKFINQTQKFSPTVEARLNAAIEELGYRSNPLARSMITGVTRTIGLAVLDIRNPHFTNVVKGANRIAMQHGYTLLLVDTEESPERERMLIEALAQRVDGLILSTRMPEHAADWLLELNRPVVLLGNTQQLAIPSVGNDSYQAAYMLTRHLLNLGHKNIAYVGFVPSRWNAERTRGITDCLAERGLAPILYDTDAPSPLAGEQVCAAVMLGAHEVHAVICYNDLIALGFMKEARNLGLNIPADVSIAAFDNIIYGQYACPALTTVDMQSERVGEQAMTRLLSELNGGVGESATKLEPRLIVRDSTARRVEAR